MVSRFSRLLAFATLVALVGLNGEGFLLAYSEADLVEGERCSQSCCNLGKAGAAYASSCCRLRCHEDTGETNSEPAREQISLKKAGTQATLLQKLSTPLVITGISRTSLQWDFQSRDDGQVDLHIKNSVLLV